MLAPHFIRIVLNGAPAEARGPAVGLAFTAIYLGDLLNPFVIHPLAVAIGLHHAFLLVGAIVAVTALQIIVPRRTGRLVEEPQAALVPTSRS
jgi:hypothetical protein